MISLFVTGCSIVSLYGGARFTGASHLVRTKVEGEAVRLPLPVEPVPENSPVEEVDLSSCSLCLLLEDKWYLLVQPFLGCL
jgi:hypothetical protein